MVRSKSSKRGGRFNDFNNTLKVLPTSSFYPQNTNVSSMPSSARVGGKRKSKRNRKSKRKYKGGFGAMDVLSSVVPFSSFSNSPNTLPFHANIPTAYFKPAYA